MRRYVQVWSVCVVLGCTGTPSDDDAGAAVDAASSGGTDAGTVDAAVPADAGPPDAFTAPDAADAGDAGWDAGVPDAAAPPPDAGTAQDAAVVPDAAVIVVDAGPSCGELAHDIPGVTRTVNGPFTTLHNVPATALGNTRTVTVRVPQGTGPFPVLYAHDGQNLFDSARAAFGVEWGLDETAAALEAEGVRFIVVGVDNNADRMDEYTPVADSAYGGGAGDLYLDFLEHDLKPYIDFRFPTACGREDTAILGSSLGGLISFHAGMTRSGVFGRVAALSPSFWWADRWIVDRYNLQSSAPSLILWIDAGTDETTETPTNYPDFASSGYTWLLEDTREVRDRARALGYVFGDTLGYLEAERMAHNEYAWSQRLRSILLFLFSRPAPAVRTAYAWALRNPVQRGASTPVVLQVVHQDGRRLTVPQDLSGLTAATGGGSVDARGWLQPGSAGAAALSGTWGGVTGTGGVMIMDGAPGLLELILEVDVPADTPSGSTVYVTGDVEGLGSWNPGLLPLTSLTKTRWRGAFLVPPGTVHFKFTRGDWATVEVAADGTDIADRASQDVAPRVEILSVARWHDL